jgi:transcriptional regulator with XRE-family HTH domain
MPEPEVTRMDVAARLKAAREQAGLSQGQAARLLDMHRPTISEIEAGRRRVTAEELARFADIFGVSISWLATDQPDVPDPKVELAARELAKLKDDDLDTVLRLLRTLRKAEKPKK